VTDANLVLGRLIPEFFPKIFGKSEKEMLDKEISFKNMKIMTDEVNKSRSSEDGSALGGGSGGKELSVEQVAWGFAQVANETMCRPIR
jgi:5-oxoprolinase (ATP-hydrolysing)